MIVWDAPQIWHLFYCSNWNLQAHLDLYQQKNEKDLHLHSLYERSCQQEFHESPALAKRSAGEQSNF